MLYLWTQYRLELYCDKVLLKDKSEELYALLHSCEGGRVHEEFYSLLHVRTGKYVIHSCGEIIMINSLNAFSRDNGLMPCVQLMDEEIENVKTDVRPIGDNTFMAICPICSRLNILYTVNAQDQVCTHCVVGSFDSLTVIFTMKGAAA